MLVMALRMLMGDRAKYLGIVIALAFTSFVMIQQPATFLGILRHTYGFITDVGVGDVWVMDPKARHLDDVKPMMDAELQRVRGIDGVEWAMPLYKGGIRARLDSGDFVQCQLVGIDETTLIGGPGRMVLGKLADLRQSDGIIVDAAAAQGQLAARADGSRRPLGLGESIELNEHRAQVVGTATASSNFQSMPTLYTTYARVKTFLPSERKLLSFVLVTVKPGEDAEKVAAEISRRTGLAAYTTQGFIDRSLRHFLGNTGMIINFAMSAGLGFLIGAFIAGQTFFNFTTDNLRHFGVMKAMGAGTAMLVRMILVQALYLGSMGFGLGAGAGAVMGFQLANVDPHLVFRLPWQLILGGGMAALTVIIVAALLAIRKVVRLEPAQVFKA
ncbi:ABC transporter permease [Magnetospirillum sp. J10]|uniref:ABC transporter permease n=2 Tax=Magnetospirillum sulfuroxidans TaxID=611300 RepID=A0ABS5IAL5_9PROT|nr:ABC transporter permease [Magnetospirillum sulfuroxidans]